MTILNFFAYPVYPESINFVWEMSNSQLEGNYRFNIYDANTKKDISGLLVNAYKFTSIYTGLLSISVREQMKFTLVATPPIVNEHRGWVQEEKTTTLYRDRNFDIVRDIIRRENVRFSKKVGVMVRVLKRKTYGEKCFQCLDVLTGVSMNGVCSSCYGTKIVGGYWIEDEMWGEIEEQPTQKQVMDITTVENKSSHIRLANNVLVAKKDIVVDTQNNNRWEMSNEPTVTRYRGFPVSQMGQAHLLNTKSPVYSVKI